MRKIKKTAEPPSLTEWKKANPGKTRYTQLPDNVRRSIREQALQDQYYLCAYCCCQIKSADKEECHNEHMDARGNNHKRELDFSNIVVSCNARNQCGSSHKSQDLDLVPVMHECEAELQFMLSGRVRGRSPRAVEAIRILNLGDSEKNNKALVEKRKRLVDIILYKNGVGPESEAELEDDEIVEMLLHDILAPMDGRLESFAPVAANIIKNWLCK